MEKLRRVLSGQDDEEQDLTAQRNWVAMASQWHETLRSILHPWKPRCIGQYLLFNGTSVPVEEEGAGLALLHIAVLVNDLRWSHGLRTPGRCPAAEVATVGDVDICPTSRMQADAVLKCCSSLIS
ncbi:Vesicle transport protein SFT2A [Apodemus speciosus]|uniref:Vesicle transport protein SFT2A n=1 Tax=Apodemus speciosus TaxID=105296 RepID=A0ABQ0FN84_APOSI